MSDSSFTRLFVKTSEGYISLNHIAIVSHTSEGVLIGLSNGDEIEIKGEAAAEVLSFLAELPFTADESRLSELQGRLSANTVVLLDALAVIKEAIESIGNNLKPLKHTREHEK